MSEWGQYVPGYGPIGAKLAVIGIAPGADELAAGIPFVGPSGSILNHDLIEAGLSGIHEVYRTNIFKYKLPNNEFKRYHEMGLDLVSAMADLTHEINSLNPNCILGLGDPVLYSLAGKSGKHNGINAWRGSILHCLNRKTIFTWHPAHELHSSNEDVKGQYKSWQKYVRKFDVKRAVEQSKFKESRVPHRLLHVAGSSADVYRYLEKNRNKLFCAVDIESIEDVPVCIGLSFDSHEGFCIPLWNTLPIKVFNQRHPKKSYSYNLQVSGMPTPDIAQIWKWVAGFLADSKYKFIGQNFKYDQDKLNHLGFYMKLYWDTMIGTHCINSEMPKSLAFQTSINTEEPFYKNEGKNFNPMRDKIEDFFYYNCKDACVTREIFDAQVRDLGEIPHGMSHAEWRMQMHDLYLSIDREGFQIDEDERRALIYKYVGKLVDLEAELFEITKSYGVLEPVLLSSPQQVANLLYRTMGIPVRKGKARKGVEAKESTGEQVITALLGNIVKKPDQIRTCEIILDHRRINKSLGYLKANADYDGRMKTTFLITGTENFRTSTNSLDVPIRPEEMGWAFQTVSKHGDIGNDLRSILIADRGYVIVNMDQGQAEARVCSLLADDEDTLRSYDTGDKHALTASKFFGGNENTYSKKKLGFECPERFVGKTLRHAYHLGITKREAMINVNTDARKYKIPIRISEWRAGECLKILERDTPKIQTVFHNTIQELLRSNRRITGTFGASRYFFDEMETRDLWKGAYSFIPQQTVSDKTKYVGLKVRKNFWNIVKIVCESHDALTFLIPDTELLYDIVEEIRGYFHEPISFADCSIPRHDLVIPCDVEIGYNYCDLEKFKSKKSKVA